MRATLLLILISLGLVLSTQFLGEQPVIGGIHDYIFNLPRDTLNRWALATEKYHRKANNQEGIIGGLDDYINSLSNKEVISLILKEVDEHPELNSREKLESISTEFGFGGMIFGQARGGDGGLHDFIWRLPRDKLNVWALSTEAYHRDIGHLHLMGGLDDYIDSLSNDQVIEYIMKEVKEHPEIASAEKLDNIATKFNISVNSVHKVVKSSPLIGGGLHDVVRTLKRRELVEMAYTFEKYHNGNQIVIGGLHDYIFNQSNEEIITYIMSEAKEHPEIANVQKLKELSTQYNNGETFKLASRDQTISESLSKLDRIHIIAYAITLDHYDLEKNPTRIGGIDDTAHALPSEELVTFIYELLRKYPEADSITQIEKLMVQYKIEFKDY